MADISGSVYRRQNTAFSMPPGKSGVYGRPRSIRGGSTVQIKEAVALAKRHVRDVFAEEKIDNIRLEEVEFDDKLGNWSITLGFSRPWEESSKTLAAQLAGFVPQRRDLKVVRIRDADSKVISVKNREPVLD